ncbi:MAG: NAD(P)/FAD-dependent oxidoreductase [Candidatus Thermoplasmatota archaeon]
MYDVIIVGAGPAGLFASNELIAKKIKPLVIDCGREIEKRKCPIDGLVTCLDCKPCNIMCGIGGSGTFSDGILNLRPDIGGNLGAYVEEPDDAWELVHYVDKVFQTYGAPSDEIKIDYALIDELKRKAASVGARFLEIPQRHFGSENCKRIIGNFVNDLKKKGVDFLPNTTVTDLIIESSECKGVITKSGKLKGKKVLIAPGRFGVFWVEEIVKKYKINARYAPVDLGVRVEVPSIIMEPIIKINRDPKFHIRTKVYDDFVRTFCTNHMGYVVKEVYENFVATNGHSMIKRKSENTNFAFLTRVELTEPVENTTMYARSVAQLATNIGGGKPIIQRMGDLDAGRRSTKKRLDRNPVKPTLTDVTPGDIAMALPHRIVVDIIEGLKILDKIIPGVASDSTLLYAPEVKFYAMQLIVNKNFETSISNLFAAGDGAGLSRGIVGSAATGILAARGMISKTIAHST